MPTAHMRMQSSTFELLADYPILAAATSEHTGRFVLI